ncbi:MAG: HAD-IIA family hydrolase [Planctomycetota bacterium]|nr:HAD-IIA family hydrolase [Planctomycetota bacterium]
MSSESRARLAQIRHFVLDLDGTVYTGSRLHEDALDFLAALQTRGSSYTFLTNNTSLSRQDYIEKLRAFGIEASSSQVCTPVSSTVASLRESHPSVASLFVLGTDALRADFESAGFAVGESAEADPDAVVVGFDTSLSYQRLCRAAWWISRGLPYLATHPDLVCPTEEPTILVDCGSICAALRAACGRDPDAVFGKPDPGMLEEIADRQGIAVGELAMVGDRLMTDMAMATRAGALAILVLTGEATESDIAELGPADPGRPDLVLKDLAALTGIL